VSWVQYIRKGLRPQMKRLPKMETSFTDTKQKIKRELADFLGVDMEDVEDETSLTEDLHMNPSTLADFAEILNKAGFPVESSELVDVETFSDLVEMLTIHE
jgi:acyl carrier protein